MAEKQVTEARVRELIAESIKLAMIEVKNILNEMVAKALAELVTKEDVAADFQKIIDNLKNFVSTDALDERLLDLVTKDQWNQALDAMFSEPVPLTGIRPELAAAESSADPIPPEYLIGLVFRSSKPKKTDGGKVNLPTERQLSPEDVLSWKDNGETVTIITTDGQKHTVDKE